MHNNVKTASNSCSQNPSRALSLPAELRNKIYRYCLIVDDKDDEGYPGIVNSKGLFILVTKRVKEPPLLSVCRQVRKETLEIWYIANKFHVQITDYDASLYLAWRKHMDGLPSRTKAQKISYRIFGQPNWDKLKKWCHAVWAGIPAIRTDKQSNSKARIVDAAHRIAFESRGKPWKKCEYQLEGLRKVLG